MFIFNLVFLKTVTNFNALDCRKFFYHLIYYSIGVRHGLAANKSFVTYRNHQKSRDTIREI